MSNSVKWYNENAEAVSEQYESVKPQDVHTWLVGYLPQSTT